MTLFKQQLAERADKLRNFAGVTPHEDWYTRGEMDILEAVLNITHEDLED